MSHIQIVLVLSVWALNNFLLEEIEETTKRCLYVAKTSILRLIKKCLNSYNILFILLELSTLFVSLPYLMESKDSIVTITKERLRYYPFVESRQFHNTRIIDKNAHVCAI